MDNVPKHNKYRNAIDASWKRCERDYGLQRNATYPVLRLRSTEIAPRQEALEEQIGGRRGVFQHLSEIAGRMGHCIVFCDADRVLVRFACKNKGHSDFERYGIAPGSCWNEQIAGTNGVAMAMSHGDTFTVRGKDHFFSKLLPFACTAVPLLDARNKIIGAANLAMIDHGNEAEYVFTQKLLEQAARDIQRRLFKQHFKHSLILSVSDAGENSLLPRDELIAVDGSGIVSGATSKAGHLPNAMHTSLVQGQSIEALTGYTLDELANQPAKVHTARFDTGSGLNLKLDEANPIHYHGKGWDNVRGKQKHECNRQDYSRSLKDLSIGSAAMKVMIEQAQVCFDSGIPLLLEGESGVGKSVLVKALHSSAGYSLSHLVTIDCAALEENKKDESYFDTLVHHAFVSQALRAGNSSLVTLLLENVDELPGYGQIRLRSLLEKMESDEDIGSEMPAYSSLRVIATTRHALQEATQGGSFRDDLYYLLSGARFVLPPLYQRKGRVKLARSLAATLAGAASVELTDESVRAIQNYRWPGNVRELKNVLRQCLIAGNGRRIALIDLSRFIKTDRASCSENRLISGRTPPLFEYDERTALLDALLGEDWNVSRASRSMGISRATIHRKMNRYGITRPSKSATDN